MKKTLAVLALWAMVLLAGCTHVPQSQLLARQYNQADLTVLLANDIGKLSDAIDPREAYQLADTAIKTTYALAEKYGMSGPPEYHNIMVNMGLRSRGLCWHWASDLLTAFFALNLQTIDFMWAVAHEGSSLSEHNVAVIVPANAMVFAEGLIYDPWRTSGQPYWVLLKDDVKYPWVELPRADW